MLTRDGEVELAPAVAHRLEARIRRMAVLDGVRSMLGVGNEEVAGWIRRRRTALDGRSILVQLTEGDERAYRDTLGWLLGGMPSACGTVH